MTKSDKHLPRVITQTFPLSEEAAEQKRPVVSEGLWLPKQTLEPCPLIVRISNGEDVSQETAYLTDAGFAVYVCYADQIAMERDLDTCAAWQAELEQKLDGLLRENPALDAERIFVDGWLTAYLIFHTHRFQAAVQRPVLIHRATAFGNCAAGEVSFSAEPLLEQMKKLAAQSVLADVDNCKTPCMVLYQEGNVRYSREQSEQLYAAMKDRNGDISCRMVVIPNNRACDWQTVCLEELLAWWKRFSDRKGEAK